MEMSLDAEVVKSQFFPCSTISRTALKVHHQEMPEFKDNSFQWSWTQVSQLTGDVQLPGLYDESLSTTSESSTSVTSTEVEICTRKLKHIKNNHLHHSQTQQSTKHFTGIATWRRNWTSIKNLSLSALQISFCHRKFQPTFLLIIWLKNPITYI